MPTRGATIVVLETAFAALGRWRGRWADEQAYGADRQMRRYMGQQDRQTGRCMGQKDRQMDRHISQADSLGKRRGR